MKTNIKKKSSLRKQGSHDVHWIPAFAGMTSSKWLFFRGFIKCIFTLIFLAGCTQGTGTLTIANTTPETANITFGGKNIALSPDQHFIQKDLKAGSYDIVIGAKPPINATVENKRTTLVDVAGNSCFAVADYTDQYSEKGGGGVKIAEKFVNKQSFVTSFQMTSELGETLPEGIKGPKKVMRLHRIDCSWIDNDQAIIDAIANLP